MTALLANCKTILSGLPLGLFNNRQSQSVLQDVETDVLRGAFRTKPRSLLSSCEPLPITHIYVPSTKVPVGRIRPPRIAHSANEQETDSECFSDDSESMRVSPVTPAYPDPRRTPSSPSKRVKPRVSDCKTSPKCQEKPLAFQGGSTGQKIQKRRPQRRRSRSVAPPQQKTRVRKRSSSVSQVTGCQAAEQKEPKPLHVRFAENETYVLSREEDDEADEDTPARGRSSSIRIGGVRTPRSPTPFCRRPLNISDDDDEEDEHNEEDTGEQNDKRLGSRGFADESGADAQQVDKNWLHSESFAFEADRREEVVCTETHDSKSARHSVRFAQQELVCDRSFKAEEVTFRVPQSKGRTRSRRDPTPFVRRVYEPSDSEEDEVEDKSSKTEGGTIITANNGSDEGSEGESASEDEQRRHRVRETSPMRDEVVHNERIPLRKRLGVNDTNEQSPKGRKRQVQFSDLPSREHNTDSNLKKVSSRRPTPVGPRGYTVDQEEDDSDVCSS